MAHRLPTSKAREQFADLLNEVAFKGHRVLLHRHGKDVAAYVDASNNTTYHDAVLFGVNGSAAVGEGGWVGRNADGNPTTSILTNAFMEGGITLSDIGFTGCVSTVMQHTR